MDVTVELIRAILLYDKFVLKRLGTSWVYFSCLEYYVHYAREELGM
jgi:hypothetical protein